LTNSIGYHPDTKKFRLNFTDENDTDFVTFIQRQWPEECKLDPSIVALKAQKINHIETQRTKLLPCMPKPEDLRTPDTTYPINIVLSPLWPDDDKPVWNIKYHERTSPTTYNERNVRLTLLEGDRVEFDDVAKSSCQLTELKDVLTAFFKRSIKTYTDAPLKIINPK
jgi:hypothetical protein